MKASLCISLLLLFTSLSLPTFGAPKTLAEWNFRDAKDTLGWTVADAISEFKVSDGAMISAEGPGQQKLESPIFDITAGPWQRVEIEMKTDADGDCLMYYSNTTEEPYHGFRPGQYAAFKVRGDGDYHTYTIRPFWQKQKKVTHVRFDPPGKRTEIRSIRIIDASPSDVSTSASWNFKGSTAGWEPVDESAQIKAAISGAQITGNRSAAVLSPAVNIDSDTNLWATIRAQCDKPQTAFFVWASDEFDGLQKTPIQLISDGFVHSYTIDLSDAGEWGGKILAVGITPTDSENSSSLIVESVDVGHSPTGPAELRITNVEFSEPAVRAGDRTKLIVRIKNIGGVPAENLIVSAEEMHRTDHRDGILDDSRTHSSIPTTERTMLRLEAGDSVTMAWPVTPGGVEKARFECSVKAEDIPPTSLSREFKLFPKMDKVIPPTGYVPEPIPVNTGKYQVGAYYFPGWHTYDRWAVLDNFPERKPVLGYYREGDPEIVDWQISWAKSHGIDFFIYDWYWTQGSRQLEHGLHDAFLKSKYQDRFKFCLLWANHNPPKTHSEEDLLKVTQYWIDNYFKLPNYLKVDGKNVMVIFSPWGLANDMGHEAVKIAFAKMKKMCEDSGVGGLYLVGCMYPGDHLKAFAAEGYDAFSGYNYPPAGSKGQQYAPYEWMVDGYKEYWNQISDTSGITYIPVCEPGWDARPWHGYKSQVRTGKSPQLWQKMLQNAKQFVDDPKHKQPGAKKLVFLEAWNEFGEGDYIEPHAEFGFDYLEAVRQVYAPGSKKPQIILPKDVGMGPYDFKQPETKTSWDFSVREDQTWSIGNMVAFNYSDGVMRAEAMRDPAFYSPYTKIDASKLKIIEIKMKMDQGTEAQLFFTRPRGTMSEEKSMRFAVYADNQWHVYTLDMTQNPRWINTIGQLRLDPNEAPGSKVEVAYVRVK